MIRRFCDACGTELTGANNAGHRLKAERTFRPKLHTATPVAVECIVSVNGCSDGGDICTTCVIDTVMAADPRPRQEG